MIEQIFFLQRCASELTHRIDVALRQTIGDAFADAPEVSQRLIFPEPSAIAHFVQFGDAYAVTVSRDVFGHDIHSYLGKIEVGPNAGGGCDASLSEHVTYNHYVELMGGHAVSI